MPIPALGRRFGWHLFWDAGRVWIGDSRFSSGSDRFGQERFFHTTGGGLDILTPIGAIKLSLGYKLNPSLLDLVDSDDLLRALTENTPTDELEKHSIRRWQFHLTVATSY